MEKKKIILKKGVLNVFSTQNNTIASISDIHGNILCWSSCGTVSNKGKNGKKFKGTYKKTENAAFIAIKSVCFKCKKFGIKQISVHLKHYGSAIEIFIQAIKEARLSVTSISDYTPLPFNGCRPQKKKRKKRHIKNKDVNYVKVRHEKQYN